MAFSVISGGATFLLWNWYSDVKDQLEIVQIAREKAEANLQLVSDQLAREVEIRRAAQEALSQLRTVPDVDYNTPLPDSIGDVLRDFRERMQ
ncbi:hypothetical protein HYO99_gp74 [Roseobacter phage RD-1410W1-01]|uniref:Uncharacterized protein n=1 Tax=Roseobacter phage RD-1410W1-01 TaxID=1815984 RepID=A0A191VYM3_9CAUD|nr:hypothetical protein HYO99_gp74 [Roseobacter phage RD-1410W1-01]ANJ20808.1 hypothetical protein RDp01_gp74 [Roseobacter phage RD-1410W1-01]